MRYFILAAFVFVACNAAEQKEEKQKIDSTGQKDSIIKNENKPDSPAVTGIYSNERFRDVTVEKIGTGKFRIKGKAQIFEANFSWVIEDGHNEIKSGFQMTDAGAPEWGNFDFTVEVPQPEPASTLHIILFEVSAKDGSRVYELPIRLN